MIRKFAFLAAFLALTACTTPNTGGGPSSAGAPQPATNLAQTARDQAAVPGQAYGGHNYMYFAAQGAAAIQQSILDIAKTEKWTAEQITQALAATNGAPQSVTISVGGNLSGGDADNAGAGTGGSGSAAGSGTVQRP
jgi:hypothetical protein